MAYDAGMHFGRIRGEELYVRVQNMLDRHYAEVFGFPSTGRFGRGILFLRRLS